jgi:hypothetical protein
LTVAIPLPYSTSGYGSQAQIILNRFHAAAEAASCTPHHEKIAARRIFALFHGKITSTIPV